MTENVIPIGQTAEPGSPEDLRPAWPEGAKACHRVLSVGQRMPCLGIGCSLWVEIHGPGGENGQTRVTGACADMFVALQANALANNVGRLANVIAERGAPTVNLADLRRGRH